MRHVGRTWLFGVGKSALYDSYLSPLDYRGPSLSISMTNERTARWGKGRVDSYARWAIVGTMAENAVGNADFYDGTVDFSLGWHYRWSFPRHWTLRAGALAELSFGGTYSSRNGNNPAQGRAALDVAASVMADYDFRLLSRLFSLRLQADAPVVGMMFSPQYGQSYYEIFSLGHTSGIVHPTWTGNCPTARLEATVSFPTGRNRWTFGYVADIRQSSLGGLKRHAWRHNLVVGYAFRCFKL